MPSAPTFKETGSGSRQAILERLKRAGPSVANELAENLAVSDVAIRQHLHALAEDGLVAFIEEQRGRGRPTRIWHLTDLAQRRFADTHAELSVTLLDAALDALGADAVPRLLAQSVRTTITRYRTRIPLDGRLCRKVRALADLRSAEGYMAEVVRESSGVWLLIENHCPIGSAATRCAGICGSELQLFREVLGNQHTVERREDLSSGSRRCVYVISDRQPRDHGTARRTAQASAPAPA